MQYSSHLYIMREENQLRIICRIIENYRLDQPFSRYLKDFFKTHPQMGSRDRKQAASFSYNYFRTGKALADCRLIERLTLSNFLCAENDHPLLNYCISRYSLVHAADIHSPVEEKIRKIDSSYPGLMHQNKFFPFQSHLSEQVNRQKFVQSILHQPKLWIRIKRKFREQVYREFREKEFSFEADESNPLSISFANSTRLDKTESFEKGYFEIQDWSSQQTLLLVDPKPGETWWDACAGSGGKSLMMLDAEPSLKIFATDSRASILENLKSRFEKAGEKNLQTVQMDLTSMNPENAGSLLQHGTDADAILADVPCSGSGTWSRTPEWLLMFDDKEIRRYQLLQRNIVKNLAGTMTAGMPLIYITCSVFKEENEENIEWIEANTPLFLQKSEYIEGADCKADTLFIARFRIQ